MARNEKAPFLEWIKWVNKKDSARIRAFVDRLACGGSKGNLRNLKDGVWEIKMSFGKGFRVYFGKDGEKLFLLLLGSDKHNQKKDIKIAKEYWRKYGEQKHKL